MKYSPELIALAFNIADSCARSDIEVFCAGVTIDDDHWYDLGAVDGIDLDAAHEAMKYLQLRGAGLSFSVVRHENATNLCRFTSASVSDETTR